MARGRVRGDSDVPSQNVYENKGTPEPNHPSPIAIRQWPDCCSSRNEGVSGDVVENKGSGTRDTGVRDTRRADSSFCPPRNAGPRGGGRACACNGISWERTENKGTPEPNTDHKSTFANAVAPALREMKVQPEVLLKTKETVRRRKSEVEQLPSLVRRF
jgi:hypothetical protein